MSTQICVGGGYYGRKKKKRSKILFTDLRKNIVNRRNKNVY